jgi:hypothetical protein
MKILISIAWRARTPLAAWKPGVRISPWKMGSRRTETKRRTPTPAKITFAGENVYGIDILEEILSTGRHLNAYKADTLAKHGRGDTEDIHCRNKPLCESDIGILGLRELGEFLS